MISGFDLAVQSEALVKAKSVALRELIYLIDYGATEGYRRMEQFRVYEH